MSLTAHQRRYLLIYQAAVPLVINILICGLIGWNDYRGLTKLPVWGIPKSMAVDLVATSFLLPCITCLIATPLIRRDVRLGTVAGLESPLQWPAWLTFYRRPLLLRAPLWGLSGLMVVGTLAVMLLSLLPLSDAAVSHFLAGKLTFAGLYGAAVTPAIAIVAMSEGATAERACRS